jgi:uncharacterized damage-inducible protein DinB
MDRMRVYEYLVKSRGRVLDWVRPLGAEAYGRAFSVGRGTIGRTLTHMLGSEWYYVMRMTGQAVPAYEAWPIREEEPLGFEALEAEWGRQAERTREAIRGVRDWDAGIEYRIVNDAGRAEMIRASASDIFTQLTFHEIHHRAQVMNNLRQCGVAAEDIDYNTMMYERRAVE